MKYILSIKYITLILCIIILLSCKKSIDKLSTDKIKFDFYVSNFNNKFKMKDKSTYVYYSDISISDLDNGNKSQICYTAYFHLSDSINSNAQFVPITIQCYNFENKLVKQYVGCSATIDVNYKTQNENENKLLELIKSDKLSEFLENYYIKNF